MTTAQELSDIRQGELLYLCSRLVAAIFAFHEDALRTEHERNMWWHINLNTSLVSLFSDFYRT